MASTAEDNPALYCTICMNQYDKDKYQPKLLNCHHSFCLGCINKLVSFGSILCPNCKQRTAVPSGGTIKLQYNFYSDLMRESANHLADGDNNLCPEHGKTLDIWCKCCMKSICAKCAFGDHKSHKQDDVDTMHNDVKHRLAEKLKPLKEKERYYKGYLRYLETKKDAMEKCINELDQEFDGLFKQLETKKNEIKDCIIGKSGEDLNTDIEENKLSLASIESICNIYEKTQNSTAESVLRVIDSSDIEHERKRLLNQPESCYDSGAEYVYLETNFLANVKQNISKAIVAVSLPRKNERESNTADSAESDVKSSSLNTVPSENHTSDDALPCVYVESTPIYAPLLVIDAQCIAAGNNGTIYVSCSDKHQIEKFNVDFDRLGHIWFGFAWKPYDVTVNKHNNDILCSCYKVNKHGDDLITNCIKISTENDSKPSRTIFIDNADRIGGLVVGKHQQILCSTINRQIFVLNQQGLVLNLIDLTHVIPARLEANLKIAVHSDNMFVVGYGHCMIHVLGEYGIPRRIGGKGKRKGRFMSISGMAVDSEGNILVCDDKKNDVQLLSKQGECMFSFKTDTDLMECPRDVAISDCYMFVVDGNFMFKFKYK